MVSASSSTDQLVARILRPFAKVEASEAITAAVMTAAVFLLLLSYYIIKTAREPLILLHGGAEVKSYAAAGQALLLIPALRVYTELAKRVGRIQLVGGTFGFFAMNLGLFALASEANWSIGVAFYLWVGVFNYTVIAQFWSFANDIYTPEQGKRLFAILGIGSSLGAVAGSFVAARIASWTPGQMMLTTAGLLLVCILILAWVNRRVVRQRRAAQLSLNSESEPEPEPPVKLDEPLLTFLLRDKYLLLLAALTFLTNAVNSNGEYVLDRTLLESVTAGGASTEDARRFIGAFKADYFGWVNIFGVLMQLFVVSRILTRFGVRAALFILPSVAFLSYSVVLATPVLALIRIGKIAENSLDYSIQNTARQALFLVTSRAEKYVGKTAIDTICVRLGDVFSAGAVWFAAHYALPTKAFAGFNLCLILLWLVVLLAIGREHMQRSAEPPLAATPELSR